jgi:hypothetical protein
LGGVSPLQSAAIDGCNPASRRRYKWRFVRIVKAAASTTSKAVGWQYFFSVGISGDLAQLHLACNPSLQFRSNLHDIGRILDPSSEISSGGKYGIEMMLRWILKMDLS